MPVSQARENQLKAARTLLQQARARLVLTERHINRILRGTSTLEELGYGMSKTLSGAKRRVSAATDLIGILTGA